MDDLLRAAAAEACRREAERMQAEHLRSIYYTSSAEEDPCYSPSAMLGVPVFFPKPKPLLGEMYMTPNERPTEPL